jgi:mono/diheme cytochrome c family protein
MRSRQYPNEIITFVISIKRLLNRLLCAMLLVASSLPCLASAKSKQAEQAGANLFRDKGCAYCHGATTAGTPKGPSLLDVRKTMKAPQITDQILNGGRKMPPFSDSLKNDEVAQLVAWLRAKHRPAPTPQAKPNPAPAPAPQP